MRTKIIYEDDDILVIHKPPGLATQAKGVGQMDVVSELKSYLMKSGAKQPYAGIVHRLDQPVEGLLVFGKNQKATAKLTAGLKNSQLNKKYYATICGNIPKDCGKLVDYMYKSAEQRAEIVPESESGKNGVVKAVLSYEVKSRNENCCVVDVSLETGRFHQIRAQFAHAGFPLLGDRKYGTDRSEQVSRELGVRNVALLAYELSVVHPTTGEALHFSIESQLPGYQNS